MTIFKKSVIKKTIIIIILLILGTLAFSIGFLIGFVTDNKDRNDTKLVVAQEQNEIQIAKDYAPIKSNPIIQYSDIKKIELATVDCFDLAEDTEFNRSYLRDLKTYNDAYECYLYFYKLDNLKSKELIHKFDYSRGDPNKNWGKFTLQGKIDNNLVILEDYVISSADDKFVHKKALSLFELDTKEVKQIINLTKSSGLQSAIDLGERGAILGVIVDNYNDKIIYAYRRTILSEKKSVDKYYIAEYDPATNEDRIVADDKLLKLDKEEHFEQEVQKKDEDSEKDRTVYLLPNPIQLNVIASNELIFLKIDRSSNKIWQKLNLMTQKIYNIPTGNTDIKHYLLHNGKILKTEIAENNSNNFEANLFVANIDNSEKMLIDSLNIPNERYINLVNDYRFMHNFVVFNKYSGSDEHQMYIWKNDFSGGRVYLVQDETLLEYIEEYFETPTDVRTNIGNWLMYCQFAFKDAESSDGDFECKTGEIEFNDVDKTAALSYSNPFAYNLHSALLISR